MLFVLCFCKGFKCKKYQSYLFIYLFILGSHLQHMEDPRLGVESDLQSHSNARPSRICNLHCSLWQCWIFNPLNEARDQTHIFMDTSHFLFFVFCLFRATLVAYGGSQARSLIRTAAASLRQSHHNARSEPRLRPIPQLTMQSVS